jgi:hypothetical protein
MEVTDRSQASKLIADELLVEGRGGFDFDLHFRNEMITKNLGGDSKC